MKSTCSLCRWAQTGTELPVISSHSRICTVPVRIHWTHRLVTANNTFPHGHMRRILRTYSSAAKVPNFPAASPAPLRPTLTKYLAHVLHRPCHRPYNMTTLPTASPHHVSCTPYPHNQYEYECECGSPTRGPQPRARVAVLPLQSPLPTQNAARPCPLSPA